MTAQLMKVLSTKEFSDVIAWTPSGKAFNILQPKQFVASILPEHFKSAKYSSFTRKLHRWGFMRHYRGEEAGAFFHKHFRRGRMDLVEKMTCYKPAAVSSNSSNNKKSNSSNKMSDRAPAMDTSASSRTSTSLSASNNAFTASSPTMINFGLPMGFNTFVQPHPGSFGGLPQQFFLGSLGGMTPMQQQQFLFQQQQQQQMQLQQQHIQQQMQQHHMSLGSSQGSGGANKPGDSGLDAAIEMEVTRRLKERINAASSSFSRPGIMMQQGPPQVLHSQLQPMDGRFMYGGAGVAANGACISGNSL